MEDAIKDAVVLTYFAGININCMHQLGCLKGSSVQVGSRALEALNAAVLEVRLNSSMYAHQVLKR